MKRLLMAVFAVFALSHSCFAAANLSTEQRKTFFESLVQVMQDSVNLTPRQMEKFVPVYKDYLLDIHSFEHLHMSTPVEEMTKEDVMKIMKSRFDFNRHLINVQEEVVERLSEFMEPEQLVDFMKVETQIIEKIRKTKKHRAASKK